METRDAITSRRSVHDYLGVEIPDEDLETIFEAVRWAPSSYNLQPWEFLVCRSEENKQRLRECAYDQAHVTEAGATIVAFGDMDRSAHAEDVFRDQAEKGYTAPDRADELIERMEDEDWRGNEEWVVQSTMIAATTLLYAAWDVGYATCPMGGWDGEAIVEEFDVPETWYPVLMITLGRVDEDGDEWQRERKSRRETGSFVHHGSV